MTRTALSEWGLGQLESIACLLVTELVANVILHTGSAPELTLRRRGSRLHVEVSDPDPRPPVRQRRSPLAASGRGLVLVEELASAWGWVPAEEGTGKVVWFELDASSACGSILVGP